MMDYTNKTRREQSWYIKPSNIINLGITYLSLSDKKSQISSLSDKITENYQLYEQVHYPAFILTQSLLLNI